MASDTALIPALGHNKNGGKARMALCHSVLSSETNATAVLFSWAQGLLTSSGCGRICTDLVLIPGSILSKQHLRSVRGTRKGLLQSGVLA